MKLVLQIHIHINRYVCVCTYIYNFLYGHVVFISGCGLAIREHRQLLDILKTAVFNIQLIQLLNCDKMLE